jgi:hypothetical protein
MKYEDEIATALELIEEYGKLVTWRKLSVTVAENSLTPWKPSADTEVDYDDVSIAFIPTGRIGFESLRPVKNAPDIQAGNQIGLMGAQVFEPSSKDLIIDGDKTLRIKNIVTLAPDGNAILHQIELDV